MAQRLSDRGLSVYGRFISALVAVWLGGRMLVGLFDQAGLQEPPDRSHRDRAAVRFGVRRVAQGWAPIYRYVVHLGLMGWLFTQLYGLPYWTGLVMLAWTYAIAIYVAYLRWPTRFSELEMAIPPMPLWPRRRRCSFVDRPGRPESGLCSM